MRLIPGGMKVPFRDDSLHSAIGFLVGAFPLDMSQFGHMFSTTRVPKRGADVITKAPEPPAGQPLQVVVQRGSEFHLIDVTRGDGTIVPRAELQGALREIIDASSPSEAAAEPPVGALTTLDRDTWADVRAKLEANPTNAKALSEIDSALFAVCLDDVQPSDDVEAFRTMLYVCCLSCLKSVPVEHETQKSHIRTPSRMQVCCTLVVMLFLMALVNCSYGNGRNRWFDKSFSFVFTPKGQVALNFEHSWGDGVAVLRLCNEVR